MRGMGKGFPGPMCKILVSEDFLKLPVTSSQNKNFRTKLAAGLASQLPCFPVQLAIVITTTTTTATAKPGIMAFPA
eukprot:scaffold832_cov17-Tisochrysis_lutea.AAC.5